MTRLAWYEFAGCVEVALLRFVTSSAAQLNAATTYERDYFARMGDEIVGACGERLVAKAAGLYWDGAVGTFHHVADAGPDIEVRATLRTDGRLIVRDNDPGERLYVLVVGRPPAQRIAGMIRGADARRPEFVRDPHSHRASWFVPQSALQPFARDRLAAPETMGATR